MHDRPSSPAPGHGKRLITAVGSSPRIIVVLFIAALTAVLLLVMPRSLSPDISGQLWIADRLRHGARLYLDISEINPPLWFWLAMPVDGLADMLGMRAEHVLIAGVGCAALLSLLATDRLLDQYPPETRAAFLLYGACILLIMPLRDLGQREQIALICALPYALLIAARRQGRPVPVALVLLVATGAASGIALKHYFVGVPVLLEVWLVASLRRDWRPFRPELIVLVAGALGYAAVILILTPGYLQVSVPELALAYGASGAPSLRYMIRPAQPIWVVILWGIWAQRAMTGRRLSPTATAFLIAAGGFFLAWLIQHKGWPYQSIATTGMLAFAMAAAFADNALRRPRPILVTALVLPILLVTVPTQWVPASDTDIGPALVGLAPGDTVAIVSKEGRTAWPSTVNQDLRFSGRRGSFWIFAAVDANALGANDPRITALGSKVVRETVLDYRCLPPKRIVFAPGRAPKGVTTASNNPLKYFLRDPQFAHLLAHYRRLDVPGAIDAFEATRPLVPLRSAECPRGI